MVGEGVEVALGMISVVAFTGGSMTLVQLRMLPAMWTMGFSCTSPFVRCQFAP